MNIQDVLERFALMANLSLEEAAPWIAVCSDSANEIMRSLKSNVNKFDVQPRILAAAAALAFYRYSLYRVSGSGMENFSVGEISVNTDKNAVIKFAQKIWEDSRKSIADILKDENFAFCRVIS